MTVALKQEALFLAPETKKYSDTKFMTARQKERAFDCFKRVLEARDISKMDSNLYKHLTLHCGFIAHYDIHSFKATYSGQGFRSFVEHFDRNSRAFHGWNHWVRLEGYEDINSDMVKLATAMAPTIYAELDLQQKNAEIDLCRAIAEKYGLKVVPKSNDVFVVVLVESGLIASTWVVQGTADQAIKTAKDLAAKLDLNPEEHDLAVERPFVVQSGRETVRNSERIWTWDPDENFEE